MQANKTVRINGRLYDAVTGLPIDKKQSQTAKRTASSSATTVHATTQRSQTLNRRATKKPVVERPKTGRHMDISRSQSISRFAAHPAPAKTVAAPAKPAPAVTKKAEKPDVVQKPHPAVVRAAARKEAAKPAAKTSKQIKDEAIAKALSTKTPKLPKKKAVKWRWSRRSTIISAILGLLLIGGFITYSNLPVLSVGFASAQAGIDASYPEYRPDGYSLAQPVTFSDGQVTLVFNSNSGTGGYTINQARSSWDSSALLEKVVRKTAGDNYVTTQEKGLTIYSFNNAQDATWVNGGIHYTIKTTAPLSGEQIRHIATSL